MMMDVQGAEKYIRAHLSENLPDTLFYHGFHHVQDVVNAATALAAGEGINDSESLALLRTAALFHDSGFMNTYRDHEVTGCEFVRATLPAFGYNADQIDIICGMIMATKIPQNPKNELEKIICDADLDYMGRDDFASIAQTLYEELRVRGLVGEPESWNEIQIHFISTHHYWTKTAIRTREARKQQHLIGLRHKTK